MAPPKIDAPSPAQVLNGEQQMPRESFLELLPPALLSTLYVVGRGPEARITPTRLFPKQALLPLGPNDTTVFIILGGCVVQERFPFTAKIARFRGAGQFVGEGKLLDPRSSVTTRCLSDTWVLPCAARRMNALFGQYPEARHALLCSLEARNRSDEEIYSTVSRTPLERVSALLLHLARVTGTTDGDGHTIITGPRQKDLAEALVLGQSTVENAVAKLRRRGVIDSRYRTLVVIDMDRLEHLVRMPPASRPTAQP
ncbi:Crp/Fnr family transcriptional regulator [Streptomyces sp. NBC_01481]|uniref:Crp/Fnr family transcriptional regulator n=1 Tax=Streptomyces sp. NBC_01481 TaxID=2975869 RepID=UPI00224FB400|nr:Crp/Fnr family transcriptional regulator [Streptomyces sp. NBC_01481]MCX4586833.1 Crp/Fnr family transcriptional regulator [Streptomyces sp. NBC_01481]